MKKLILAVALTLSAPALANEECVAFSKTAKEVMIARQNGAPITDLLRIAKDNKAITAVINIAYLKDRHYTSSYIQRAISDFENDMYLRCVDMKK